MRQGPGEPSSRSSNPSPAYCRNSQSARIPTRAHSPAPCPKSTGVRRGEWGSVSAGVAYRGGTMWALCLRPQAKGWERVNRPRVSASPDPAPPRGPLVGCLCSSPRLPSPLPFSTLTQAPPVQFRNFLIPGRCCSLHRARGAARQHLVPGGLRPFHSPHPLPKLPDIPSLSIPSQFYAPGGSACLLSAAAARLLGPGEPRRQSRRGEPRAPPRSHRELRCLGTSES